MSSPARRAIVAVYLLLLGALLTFQQVNDWRWAARRIGAGIEEDEAGLWVSDLTADRPAEIGGLLPGDRILEIGGSRVATLSDYDRAAARFPSRGQVTFRVRRDGVTREIVVTPGVGYPWASSLLGALACLAFAALAATAFLKAGGEPRGRLLFFYGTSVALELAMPLDWLGVPGYAVFAYPALSLLVGLQIGLELHLASTIPRPQPWRIRWRWAVPAFYAGGIGLGLLHAVTTIEQSSGSGLLPWTPELADLLFWDVGMTVWAGLLLVILAHPALRWPEPIGRQQAALVFLGVLPWVAVVFVSEIVETILGGTVPGLELADPFALFVFPLSIFLAIFRYRLFDLELVVKRSLVFALLTGVLVVLGYLVIGGGGALLSRWLEAPAGSRWTVALAALLMGLLFDPLRKLSRRLIESRFFPERRALRADLILLASELPTQGNVSSMGAELVARLREIFRLRWAALLLVDPGGTLEPVEASGVSAAALGRLILRADDPEIELIRDGRRPVEVSKAAALGGRLPSRLRPLGAELAVPLLRADQLVGLMLLGGNEFGEPFRSEEKELLSLLSHHVASVFENAQLFESATRDRLTGLLRREPVLESVERELSRARRFNRELTIGMADIDHFKQVNDRHGHLVGDLMLKQVARAMKECLRGTDLVGRYGGEEFLIVLAETGLEGSMIVAEKIREMVEGIRIPTTSGLATVTMSIGLASRSELPEESETDQATALIELADRALYAAKAAGRNRVDSYRRRETG